MLAVVGDQVPQVLSFQFSIGDAQTQTTQSFSPIDFIKEKLFQFSIGDAQRMREAEDQVRWEFQFSIGDIALLIVGFVVILLFQFSIGDAYEQQLHREAQILAFRRVSILYWRCTATT